MTANVFDFGCCVVMEVVIEAVKSTAIQKARAFCF